jgi:hypothetical protein
MNPILAQFLFLMINSTYNRTQPTLSGKLQIPNQVKRINLKR